MSDNQPETTTEKLKREIIGWIQYRTGGPKSRFFIQGLVICSKLAQYLVVGLLMTFLTDDLEMKLTHAAAIVNVRDGLTALLSIGALPLTKTVGCYHILIASSSFHSMGTVGLSISALSTYFKDKPSCFHTLLSWLSKRKAIPFYSGLVLMALGIAGQSVSLREFLVGQISAHFKDEERAKACTQFHMLVNMFIAIILSYFLVERNWALLVGAIGLLMGFATGVFRAGATFYTDIKTDASPLTCGLPVSQLDQKYKIEDGNQLQSMLTTNSVRESVEGATYASTTQDINKEEKAKEEGNARPIVFMLTTFITVGLVSSIGNTFFIEQANALDGTRFPVFILLVCDSISRSITSYGYTLLLNKFSKSPSQQSLQIRIRIGLGMLLFLLCSAIAERVEAKRLNVIKKYGLHDDGVSMSVLWLVPQFILLGSAEGLSWDGLEDFLDEKLPDSRKMYASSLSKGMNGIGKIFSVVCIAIVKAIEPNWFSDSIIGSRLDKFYWMLKIFSFLNLLWYAYIATYLTSNKVIEDGQPKQERTEQCGEWELEFKVID